MKMKKKKKKLERKSHCRYDNSVVLSSHHSSLFVILVFPFCPSLSNGSLATIFGQLLLYLFYSTAKQTVTCNISS